MQKRKKQLLGFCGLAVVGLITALATTVPTPSADAASKASASVNISLTVVGAPGINLEKPVNGTKTVNPSLDITYSYVNASRIDTTVTFQKDGVDKEVSSAFIPDEDHKYKDDLFYNTVEVNLNNEPYAGYGKYTVNAKITSTPGVYDEDSATVEYVPIIIDGVEANDEYDPVVTYQYDKLSGNICYIGFATFLDGKIQGNIVVYPSDDLKKALGDQGVIEMDEYGKKGKTYDIVAAAYGCDVDPTKIDEATPLYAPATTKFTYNRPDAPNTGFMTNTTGLNIAESDYIVTTLIVFFLMATFALVLLGRKKAPAKKSRRR